MRSSFWKRHLPYDEKAYPTQRPYTSRIGGRRKLIPAQEINRYYLPIHILRETDKIFRTFGKRNTEGYAWWTGYLINKDSAQISTVLYPHVSTQRGCVHLKGDILNAMHRSLLNLDQIVLAELHTHPPGAGGQNPVDAENATCFYPGYISIVVPDFASPRFYDLRDCFVYSYEGSGNWHELEREEIERKFIVEETAIEVKPK